jgi:hypothetical protein
LLDKLKQLFEIIFVKDKYCVVCGDKNINTLVSLTQSNILNDILDFFNQVNYVTNPTRLYGKSSRCIDHLYSNFSCSVSATVNKSCISDHFGIHMEQIAHNDTSPVKILKFKFPNKKLSNKLNSKLLIVLTIEVTFNYFIKIIRTIRPL